MRADRLLAILLLLQRGGRMTAGDIAKRLEVSERTVYRDVEALGAAGIPVYSEPGRNGGIRLLESYTTDLSGLSLSEAELLPLLGLSDVLAGIGIGPSLRRTEAKVMMALPENQRRRAEQSRRRIHVDLSRWWDHAEGVPHLATIVEAVFASKRLQIEYKAADAEDAARRTLDPYGLVVQGGVWYLVGRARQDVRTYRVSRVQSAKALAEPAVIPDDFDLAEFWVTRKEEFHQTRPGYRVVVRARTWALRSLRGSHSGDSINVLEESDEWTTIEMTCETRWIARERLLALGAGVVVVEPDELRHDIARVARDVTALYDD